MELVRDGGMVIIPQSTYDYLSYKREGAEELMAIKGLTVEIPRMGCVPAVCGTRPADISYSITQAAALNTIRKLKLNI
jgi:hypothetical protein